MKSTSNITLNNKEKLNLIRNLGIMLGAGIPILKVVDSLLNEAKGNNKVILKSLLDDLNQGKTISQAFEKFPKAFDPITTNLINASEESGNLDTTLKDVAIEIKKDIEFNDKVKSALAYPTFVFGLFLMIFLVILTYVIPRISQVFSKLDVVLPLPTKILIFMSEYLLQHYVYISIGVVIAFIFIVLLYKAQKVAFRYALFSLPLLSGLANEIDITRVTKSLGVLLKSGIPITKALNLTQQIAYRRPMAKALMQAEKDVSEGKPLGESFKKYKKVFPEMVVRFVESGEQSGNLEQTMTELFVQYEDQVANTLKRVTTLLEPMMLVVIGLFVGGIMLSIIAPIYQLIGNISPR